MRKFAFLVITASTLAATAAWADEAPICTDRPTKANGACSVPKGAWQVEADGVN